jgi:TRAP-type C4-dicarboxylate transport system permease small subunit
MKLLDSVSKRISSIAAILAAGCTIALALAITADALVRFITGRSLLGMVELSETLLVAIVFLGLSYCGYVGAHITMNLVTAALPPRVAAWARVLAYSLVVALVVWMLYATGMRAWDSFVGGEFKFGLVQWPLWPARSLIAAGILISIPVFLLTLLSNLLVALRKREAAEASPEDILTAGIV